jgi:hypothetical protein
VINQGKRGFAVITYNDVPTINHTFKYIRLGRMALENRRIFCERHGYRFISEVSIARDRPACWAKIPAILEAFKTNSWVLWADSDTLIFDLNCRLDEMCDPDYDLVIQSHEDFYRFLGIPIAEGLKRMPINTGVFFIRNSSWSRMFLQRAYEQTQFIFSGDLWNGIGEQEAMIWLLRQNPADLSRIKYVDGLQNHPRFYRRGDRFVHFYGNYAQHHIPLAECDEILGRWETANRNAAPFPPDLARFHWCCIQNIQSDSPVVRGDLGHYLYSHDDIAPLQSSCGIRQCPQDAMT